MNNYRDMIRLYNRQSKFNVGPSSDVWSLGCLLYELYTGEFLFYDQNWAKFFQRLTKEEFSIYDEEFYLKLDNNIFLIDTIKYILNRYP